MRPIVALIIAAGAALTPAVAPAQNLLLNPGFDSNLADWDLFEAFGVTAAWNAADEDAAPGSGSLRGNLPASGTFRIPIYASQCVAVQGGTSYRFGGSVLLPAATSPDNAYATVFANLYAEAACSGNSSAHLAAPNVTLRDTWVRTQDTLVAAATDRSLRIHLRVFAPAGTELSSNFDNVFVEALADALFSDGFE